MTTSPPSNKLPEPEFPVGTVVELKNNVDAIPLEDRLGIVREYFLKNTLTDSPYIAYSVELVTKPGVFRLRTKQFLKAANMPTKQPTPPPKFNIRDQVLYNFSRWKVTNRKYKNCNWLYELEAVEENKQGIHNTEAHEKFITLASPSSYDPMHFPQETKPMPDPEPGYRLLSKDPPEDLQPGDDWWEHNEQRWQRVSNPYNINQHKTTYYRRKVKTPPPPKFIVGDLVRYCNEAAKIICAAYNATENRYEYKIRIRTGTHFFHIPEDDLQIEKLVRIFDEVDSKWLDEPSPFKDRETKTVVNEQGGKQSHLDARFDCIPPVVLRLLAQCLGFGARKYDTENWKNIPQRDNLNHAMNHINEWNRGNRDEPHLVNAMARLTFALWQAVDSKDQPDTYLHPDNNQ